LAPNELCAADSCWQPPLRIKAGTSFSGPARL